MNHNMQLNINHRISFGASYTGAYHPAQITVPEKKKNHKEKEPSELCHWMNFIFLVKLVYLITCSSDEWSQSLVSKADGGNI